MKIKIRLDPVSDKIQKWDWVLISGLVLAPMTGLRVWKVGPAEVLCLLWAIRFILKTKIYLNEFVRFFGVFIVAMAIGSIVCSYISPNELDKTGLLTWLYLAIISVGLVEGLSKNTWEYNEKIIFTFAVLAIFWNVFLVMFSRTISSSFFGAPLWYGGRRYSGGGKNPHQVAVMLCGVLFIFIRKIYYKERVLLNSMLSIIAVYLMRQTRSSTGILAIVVGLLVFSYLYIVRLNSSRKGLYFVLLTFSILLVFIFGYEKLWIMFMRWVASDSNGEGRLTIFSSFPIAFYKSPIFGLGPGKHAQNGMIEFHNTYLEIVAASGIVGTVAFVLFTVRIINELFRADWTLVPILASMYAYGLAGFAMRRLVYWGIITSIFVIAKTKYSSSLMERNTC